MGEDGWVPVHPPAPISSMMPLTPAPQASDDEAELVVPLHEGWEIHVDGEARHTGENLPSEQQSGSIEMYGVPPPAPISPTSPTNSPTPSPPASGEEYVGSPLREGWEIDGEPQPYLDTGEILPSDAGVVVLVDTAETAPPRL